ncbi:hypothetical protein GWK76_02135 [Candidatus Saccharibacteria bacterium oral taxon 488]|nr:hypothetical protein GWK76_02135 [Candidatus Saccharibacteria bacterium oral taxon 488]
MPILAHRDRTPLHQLADRLPQALIITAERGLDGMGAAEYLATLTPSEVLRLQPLEAKTTITTEQVRTMIAMLRTHATVRRVIVINPADQMSEAAQNALLKSLEEPNTNTHFLLVTENEQQLLATIRSRCQVLTLHRTSQVQDETLLDATSLTASERRQILFLAAGRPLLIRQLARTPKLLSEYQAIAADAKCILSTPGSYEALRTLPSYFTDRAKALQLIDILLTMVAFQMKTQPSPAHQPLLDRIITAETRLTHNGNVRLALLNIVV